MLGFPRLSVLKSIFNKHSQPLGYTLDVSCFFDIYHVVLYFTFLVLCHCWHILFLVCDLTLNIYASADFVSLCSSLNSQFEFSSQTACFLRFNVIICTRFYFVGFAFLSVSLGAVFVTVTISDILLR